ncbi:hypothetical protein PR048_000856 [Dryococelus australis]|uniref:Reverse transcriptase/retrotransposon-derived protein RNase H-like domain-containing protein n=1 Tax=Dryococelus australis TaxID=614101 RepID=A0ABQ9IFS9_9NEOP|nr:hypothetical protein PR048_000856 [Dryococelus australis]
MLGSRLILRNVCGKLHLLLDAEGIHPTTDKTGAITNAPSPCTKQELQSLLGLISFYSGFFKDKATILEPIHCLLDSKSKWAWTTKHQVALQVVKDMLTSHQVLAHYNPDLPLAVTADASPVGVGAVLVHIIPAIEIPIAYTSRTLSAMERACSQLDRGGLAIIFAVKKFTPCLAYLLPTGQHHCLCDNPGTAVGHADCLSRPPQPTPGEDVFPEPSEVYLLEARDLRLLPDKTVANARSRSIVCPWRQAERAWERVHLDYAGPFFDTICSL